MNTELVESQEASCDFEAWWDEYQRPWLPNGVAGYEHAKLAWNAAAESMRSRCVEKVMAMRDEWRERYAILNDTELVLKSSLEGDIRVATEIIRELESVSIQEQDNEEFAPMTLNDLSRDFEEF